jgi:hypothetical protein
MCICYNVFLILKQVYEDGSDVNGEAVTNIHFRFRLSFSDVVDVVPALYNLNKSVYRRVISVAHVICL